MKIPILNDGLTNQAFQYIFQILMSFLIRETICIWMTLILPNIWSIIVMSRRRYLEFHQMNTIRKF